MRSILFAIVTALALVGCAHTEQVVTKRVVFQHGTNRVEISNPQDTSFKDLMVSPDGVVRIKDYRSSGNEAAIAAKEKEIEANALLFNNFMGMAQSYVNLFLKTYGINGPSPAPHSAIPNTTTVTNAPPR